MKILAIDTTGRQSILTLWEKNKEFWEISYSTDSKYYGESIIPNLEILLKMCNWKLEDIDLYVVTRGPGSFTGIRIGIILIKTLAQIFNKPIVAPLTLDVLAYQNKFPGTIISVIPTKRDEIHIAYYKNWDLFEKIGREKVISIKEFLKELVNIKNEILLVGEIPEIIKNNISKKVILLSYSPCLLKGATLAELGYVFFQKGEYTNYLELRPYYGQKSSAEINWERTYGRRE
jgi:tRNA threonylcarbamoyl adenosine modification protein YeaZ